MSNNSMNIHIRWCSEQDIVFSVNINQDTIADIKQKIRQLAPSHTMDKSIRLIYRGQLLREDTFTLFDYDIAPQPCIFIHCALADTISPKTLSLQAQRKHLQQNQYTNKSNTLAGFDKLKESGYNDEEILSIRNQFHQMHASSDYIEGEPPTDEQIRSEEQWMEHTGHMLPEGSAQGSVKEMICGLLLGCCLGLLCLFWFKESVFTRRHQIGIMAGMLINFCCGVNYVYY